MPQLDFLTLYIVIFLNSLTGCIIWAAVALSYRSYTPPYIWLAATILTFAGGIILSLQGNEVSFWPGAIGNVVIIYGFCLSWVGAHYFYGRRNGWWLSAVIALVSFVFMAAFHESWEGRNVVYAVGQSVPMAMTALFVHGQKRIGLGGGIAVVALALGIAGHTVETVLNIAAWMGDFDQELYFAIESYALVCVIYSGMVWNIGFIVMAMNLRHGEMVRAAETDELTGLPNRRHFMSRLGSVEQVFAENGTPYALMLIDIDNFKKLNDSYGHIVGDRALVHFANVAGGVLGATALLARTGGDEFSVLLPSVDETAAGEAAKGIVTAIRRTPLVLDGRHMDMTVSIGVAARTGDGKNSADALARADLALYRVKQAGRDGYAMTGETVSGIRSVQMSV